MRKMEPVSAVMAFAPLMPISARRNFSLKKSLANRVNSAGSGGSSLPASSEKTWATRSFGTFTAGASKCMGFPPRSCTMNSPMSVSYTSFPVSSKKLLISNSSEVMDFPLTMSFFEPTISSMIFCPSWTVSAM